MHLMSGMNTQNQAGGTMGGGDIMGGNQNFNRMMGGNNTSGL